MSTPEEKQQAAANLDAEALKLRTEAKQERTRDEAISTPVQPPSAAPAPHATSEAAQDEFQAALTGYNTITKDGMVQSNCESQDAKKE